MLLGEHQASVGKVECIDCVHRGVEEARNPRFALVPVRNYPAESKQGKRLMKHKLRKFSKDTDDCATRLWGPFPR